METTSPCQKKSFVRNRHHRKQRGGGRPRRRRNHDKSSSYTGDGRLKRTIGSEAKNQRKKGDIKVRQCKASRRLCAPLKRLRFPAMSMNRQSDVGSALLDEKASAPSKKRSIKRNKVISILLLWKSSCEACQGKKKRWEKKKGRSKGVWPTMLEAINLEGGIAVTCVGVDAAATLIQSFEENVSPAISEDLALEGEGAGVS